MGPIEVVYSTIAIMIGLVGVARGYARELGNTLVIMAGIFLLTFQETLILNLFRRTGERDFSIAVDQTDLLNFFISTAFTLVFISIVFASYSGRVFTFATFGGRQAGPPHGVLISLLVGLLNGYLIAGTLWYYQDKFNYPLQRFGLIRLPLTPTGEALVALLPQKVFESPVYWMVPVAVLLIFLVRG
jgi:hypothetical protein